MWNAKPGNTRVMPDKASPALFCYYYHTAFICVWKVVVIQGGEQEDEAGKRITADGVMREDLFSLECTGRKYKELMSLF